MRLLYNDIQKPLTDNKGWIQQRVRVSILEPSSSSDGLCADLEDGQNNVNRMEIVLKPCNYAALSQQWKNDINGRLVNRHDSTK